MSGGEGLWISRTAPLSNTIRHLHISHNALYLPPKILHNLCFSFLLNITAVPRQIENNAYAKFFFLGGGGGANKVHYESCASGALPIYQLQLKQGWS